MSKLTLSPLTTLSNQASAIATINANSDATETALENTLSRDGTTPNQMNADIDMNSNDLLNVGLVSATDITIGGTDVSGVLTQAVTAANAADTSASAAATSASNAASSAAEAAASAASITPSTEPLVELSRIGCVAGDVTAADANATKINEAIAALPATGGKVYIPAGRYYVGDISPISGRSITIEGAGPELSALIPTQSTLGSYFLDLQQDDYTDSVCLAGFSIECETVSAVRAVRIQFPEPDATNNRLQGRCTILDVEVRGVDVGSHGFLSGIDLVNVHRPIIQRVNIAGRQNGSGPTAFQHMEYGFNLTSTGTAAPTDFMFSDNTVVAAAVGYQGSGSLEGLLFDRCLAIAVGKGYSFNMAVEKPWISINKAHVAAFTACIELTKFWQSEITGCLLYKREDANADTTAILLNDCDTMKVLGNELVNVAGAPATFGNFDGVVATGSDYCIVADNIFAGLRKGVDWQGTSDNNSYRRGQWKDSNGTTTPVEYQVSGTGTGNLRRGTPFSGTNQNAADVTVSGASAVVITSVSTDNLEAGDDIEIFIRVKGVKDATADLFRVIGSKGGTAGVQFYNSLTQLDATVYIPASRDGYITFSAKATVTSPGSFVLELSGYSPLSTVTVQGGEGQLQIVRR